MFEDEFIPGTDGEAPLHLYELDADASRDFREVRKRLKAEQSFGDGFRFLLQ